ncbi:FxLYD domain-containing protein [Rubrivirga marina]|uniref:Uncharacterized protein n=1 Tax=Rubrivirga marina TaxID=1196024 RepID=A0A271IZJ8_9BACT|nr:FxLYD domain-containing protein [Rubrivirga marina]PAP76418.1 hypothetical protein BSZ37_08170 [Rubrivirga marina]
MPRPARLVALIVAVAALVALALWAFGRGDEGEAEEQQAAADPVAEMEALNAQVEVSGISLGDGTLSATLTNRSGVMLDRAVARFDLFSGGESVADASVSTFGLGPGNSAEVSTDLPGPVTIDSAAVRETVATPAP